jgi:hypothetical protein
MRVVLMKRKAGELEFGIIYGTIACIAIIAVRFLPLERLAPACVFRSVVGLPCPTCGATRSLIELSHGEVARAFLMNPLFTVVLLMTLVYFFANILAVLLQFRRVRILLSPFERSFVVGAICFLLLLNWAYLVSVMR